MQRPRRNIGRWRSIGQWKNILSIALVVGLVGSGLLGGWTLGTAQEPTEPVATAAAPAPVVEPATATEPAVTEAGQVNQPEAEAEAADESYINTGDHAWMLVSSALVLLMTAPGLALFYCGLVRRKNVLSVMMQCVFLMGLMSIIWVIYGFSLSFGDGGALIGNFDYFMLNGVQMSNGVAPQWGESTIPAMTFMLFQGMFFIITPALIVGAFAERMKFSTMCVFMILWGTLVYCPLCHWVWAGGILAEGNPYLPIAGALDFAGGTVVHISSGISALVCALLIGRRLGYGSEPMPPHNLTYTAIGATMLWVGWFGFNAGSAGCASGLAANAFAVTHLAAAAGALAWASCEWITRGKPSVLGACSGAVAGLVCITPGSGFILPTHGILVGLAGGICCFLACTALKSKFKYDDSLDVFGVHGIGGTVGAILTGVFATKAVKGGTEAVGLIDGGGVIVNQIIATAITWVLAIVVTFILLKILDATMGLRVSQDEEIEGLDLSQHGEEGYINL